MGEPTPQDERRAHRRAAAELRARVIANGSVVEAQSVNLSEGEHDKGIGEVDDAAVALAWLRARYPALPVMLAGFSFGARVVLRLAQREPVRCAT